MRATIFPFRDNAYPTVILRDEHGLGNGRGASSTSSLVPAHGQTPHLPVCGPAQSDYPTVPASSYQPHPVTVDDSWDGGVRIIRPAESPHPTASGLEQYNSGVTRSKRFKSADTQQSYSEWFQDAASHISDFARRARDGVSSLGSWAKRAYRKTGSVLASRGWTWRSGYIPPALDTDASGTWSDSGSHEPGFETWFEPTSDGRRDRQPETVWWQTQYCHGFMCYNRTLCRIPSTSIREICMDQSESVLSRLCRVAYSFCFRLQSSVNSGSMESFDEPLQSSARLPNALCACRLHSASKHVMRG